MPVEKYRYKYKNYKGEIEEGEVIRFTREAWSEIKVFTNDRAFNFEIPLGENALGILHPVNKKPHIVFEGDWISKNNRGVLRSCTPAFFKCHFTTLIPVS